MKEFLEKITIFDVKCYNIKNNKILKDLFKNKFNGYV